MNAEENLAMLGPGAEEQIRNYMFQAISDSTRMHDGTQVSVDDVRASFRIVNKYEATGLTKEDGEYTHTGLHPKTLTVDMDGTWWNQKEEYTDEEGQPRELVARRGVRTELEKHGRLLAKVLKHTHDGDGEGDPKLPMLFYQFLIQEARSIDPNADLDSYFATLRLFRRAADRASELRGKRGGPKSAPRWLAKIALYLDEQGYREGHFRAFAKALGYGDEPGMREGAGEAWRDRDTA